MWGSRRLPLCIMCNDAALRAWPQCLICSRECEALGSWMHSRKMMMMMIWKRGVSRLQMFEPFTAQTCLMNQTTRFEAILPSDDYNFMAWHFDIICPNPQILPLYQLKQAIVAHESSLIGTRIQLTADRKRCRWSDLWWYFRSACRTLPLATEIDLQEIISIAVLTLICITVPCLLTQPGGTYNLLPTGLMGLSAR
jgi:hypothetical protein